jgi:short-subunit dehydrogenase
MRYHYLAKDTKNNNLSDMNKLLVVTGGTRGIGRAIAQKFLQNGFDVVTCARNVEEADRLKQRSASSTIDIFRADLSAKEDVISFIRHVERLGRPVDVLVNNAGYFVPGGITTEPDGVLEDMMKANVYSAYYLIRGLTGRMKDKNTGHVFNLCSVASIKAYPDGGSYAITKSALLGLTRTLREELKGSGIRVTAVIPGATRTASWDGVDLPEDRFMKAEDIADMIFASYALSPRSVVEEIVIRPQLGDI